MMLTRRCNCQVMAEELGEGNQQRLHHFITASKWQFSRVMNTITLLFWQLLQQAGLEEYTCLIIDETGNSKKGRHSAGFYDKAFLYKLNGTQTVKGKAVQEIELTPIDKSKPFFKVLLYIDKSSNTIKGAKLFEKTGNRFNYSGSGFTPNAAVNDAQFAFDAKNYPGVEVVDLR